MRYSGTDSPILSVHGTEYCIPAYDSSHQKLLQSYYAEIENPLDVLTEKGLLARTLAIGGMNLPLVLTAAFADADTPLDELEAELTGEAKDQIKRFALGGDEDDDI